jgi:uncharacterized protein (DUF362 family)
VAGEFLDEKGKIKIKMEVSIYSSDGNNYDALMPKLLEPIIHLLLPNKVVFIKPNLCKLPVNNDDRKKSITDPLLIETVANFCKNLGCNVIVGEADTPRPTETAEKIFHHLNLYKFEDKGVRILNISKDDVVLFPEHEVFKNFGLSKTMLEADVIINMCKMKTHAITSFTGGLKNFWGAIPRNDRMILHHKMYYLLNDLYEYYKPALTIMDAVYCMHGRGPVNGKLIQMNLILSSVSSIALDFTACKLMKLNPFSIKHLDYAIRKSELDYDKIVLNLPENHKFEYFCKEFEPAKLDLPNKLMLFFQRFPFFSHHVVMNDTLFQPVKKMVNFLRRIHWLPE